MNWGTALLNAATWGSVYLLLAAGRSWWARWLLARFHDHRVRPPLLLAPLPRRSGWQFLAAALGLLAGAAVPLAPTIRLAGMQIPWHLVSGPMDALYPLAAAWTGSILLAAAARPDRWGRRPIAQSAARVLTGALPTVLAGLSLLLISGLIHRDREGTLHMAALIVVQGGWGGWRWLGVLQPVAAGLWMVGALPVHPGAQARTGFGWQLVLVAHTLLTAAICWGGWQGPWVERLPWLGLAYTAIKVAGITLAWTWLEVRLAEKGHLAWTQRWWPALVAVGIANLTFTAVVAVAR